MQENLHNGIAPTGELIDAALILGAGLLLITPGIVTDIVGFSLLLPPHPDRAEARYSAAY